MQRDPSSKQIDGGGAKPADTLNYLNFPSRHSDAPHLNYYGCGLFVLFRCLGGGKKRGEGGGRYNDRWSAQSRCAPFSCEIIAVIYQHSIALKERVGERENERWRAQ